MVKGDDVFVLLLFGVKEGELDDEFKSIIDICVLDVINEVVIVVVELTSSDVDGPSEVVDEVGVVGVVVVVAVIATVLLYG